MTGRLLAALALMVSGLVLGLVVGPAAPAAACSCVRLGADQYAQRADFAFLGTPTKERSTDDERVYRFTVETVHLGDVRRTQDVVTELAPGDAVDSCEQRLPLEEKVLAMGTVDDEGRLSFGRCQWPAWGLDDPFTDRLVKALPTGSEPLAGKDLVEIEATRREDLRWVGLAVGVIGLVTLGWVAVRGWRARARRTPG